MEVTDDITKSTRHQKIIGQFGEQIVCNWLSRCAFEVAIIDHTGLDLIAYRPNTGERLGITVKSRTRRAGSETDSINLFFARNNDRDKLLAACAAFGCSPWIAVYVETPGDADIYLTPLAHFDKNYRSRPDRQIDVWKMSPAFQKHYAADPFVKHLHISFDKSGWKWPKDEQNIPSNTADRETVMGVVKV